MNEEIIIDEALGKVYIFDYDQLDPDGFPLCAEYTIEEYQQLS